MSGDGAIPVAPDYPRLATDPPQPWRARADWAVAQRLDHPDAEEANGLALLDLEGGADALTLVAAPSPAARGYGLSSPSDVAAALAGVELDLIGLRLDAGAQAPAFAAAIAALVDARRLGSAGLDLDLGFDPVGLAAYGQAPGLGAVAAMVRLSEEAGLAGRPLLCDGRPWHEAGGTEAQELALVLAAAASQLRLLEAAGLSLDAARSAIAVLLPFDADMLIGLVKARAIRRLWTRLETACGLQPKPLKLHAETSWRMMTRHDPHTNAMRATAAVFSAGLGGADTVTVLPMTLVGGLPDAAARRLARNTVRVLLDEAALGAVDDPAAGSGALEALTETLCHSAWSLFQEVERGGGIEAGLHNGSIRAALAKTAQERRLDVESLSRGIVGTSRFPALDVPMPSMLDMARKPSPVSRDDTLHFQRDAEPFETLRDLADESAAAGRRPRVFLATIGEPAAFGPRTALAGNLFAAAGVATEPPPAATRDLAATIAAFRSSGTGVSCLCGAADAYAAEGEATAAALRDAGATLVLCLGGEAPGATTLRPNGETTLQVLRRTLEMLCK